jgi:hypothetical protein
MQLFDARFNSSSKATASHGANQEKIGPNEWHPENIVFLAAYWNDQT